MADQKITQLTEKVSPALTDLVPIVDDPSGTPATKKAQIGNLPFMRAAPIIITSSNGAFTLYGTSAASDTDRGTALVAAFAALVAGDELTYGPGTFSDISTQLVVPSNVTIRAIGDAKIKLAGGITATPYYTITNSDTVGGNTNINLIDLHLDGNNAANTDNAKAQSGISLETCSKCLIKNCKIEHYGRAGTASCIGIRYKALTDSIIDGNRISDTVDGINGGTTASDSLSIINNTIADGNRDYGINLANTNKSIIANNMIRNTILAGIRVITSSDSIISNNVIQSCGGVSAGDDAGLVFTSGSRNLVLGNLIRRAASTRPLYAVRLSDVTEDTYLANNDFMTGGFTGTYNDDSSINSTFMHNRINDGSVEA